MKENGENMKVKMLTFSEHLNKLIIPIFNRIYQNFHNQKFVLVGPTTDLQMNVTTQNYGMRGQLEFYKLISTKDMYCLAIHHKG
jgi:hypothetical protein